MLSIIIPTYNESQYIASLIYYLQKYSELSPEIIVVDGGSTDNTTEKAQQAGAKVLLSPNCGRAVQMNYAVSKAEGEIIYFVHADTKPPKNYDKLIFTSVKRGKQAGCFTSIFDWKHPFLRFCNYFSRLPFWFCRGGGQTLFVHKQLFKKLKGFDEEMILMEEYDFIARVREIEDFDIIRKNAITSARDYRKNGPYRLQLIYSYVFLLYAIGASQDSMLAIVRKYVKKA